MWGGNQEQSVKLQELAPIIQGSSMARHTHFYCECSYQSPGKLKAINILIVKKIQLVHSDELLSLRFQWRDDTQAARFRQLCLCEKGKRAV